jgi:hypothetical protein
MYTVNITISNTKSTVFHTLMLRLNEHKQSNILPALYQKEEDNDKFSRLICFLDNITNTKVHHRS